MADVPKAGQSREQIEEELLGELRVAEADWNVAKQTFRQVMHDVPSGLPASDGALQLSQVKAEFDSAQRRFAEALKRFNDASMILFSAALPA